jgi:hypothetical protein
LHALGQAPATTRIPRPERLQPTRSDCWPRPSRRLWHRQGRRDEARATLAAGYGTFKEGFMTPDLVEGAALLRGLA